MSDSFHSAVFRINNAHTCTTPVRLLRSKTTDNGTIDSERALRPALFPASLVIVGDEVFVTNLALALTPMTGDEPEEDVSRYTVSRIHIPKNLP